MAPPTSWLGEARPGERRKGRGGIYSLLNAMVGDFLLDSLLKATQRLRIIRLLLVFYFTLKLFILMKDLHFVLVPSFMGRLQMGFKYVRREGHTRLAALILFAPRDKMNECFY